MQRGRPQTRVPTGINRQQRRPQAAQQPNRSVPRRRPAWDTSVHDLKAYKATPEELRLRREQRVSANLAAAREDLRNRRLKPKLVEEPICACEEDSTGPEEYYDDEFYSENETEESGCSCGHNCREDASESGNEDVEYETPSRGEHSTGGDWLPQGFRPSTTRTPKVRTTAITYVGAVDKISPPAPSQSLLSKKRDKFAQALEISPNLAANRKSKCTQTEGPDMLTLQAQLNECREALQAESDEKIALQKSVQYLTEQLEEKQLMIEAITQQRDEVVQKLEQFKVTTMSEIARLRAYATRTVGALMAATNTTNGIRSTPSTTNPMQTKQSQSMSQTQCASDTNNVNTNTNTNTKT